LPFKAKDKNAFQVDPNKIEAVSSLQGCRWN